jgi:GAF domain-containing protein
MVHSLHKPAAVPPGDDIRVQFLKSLNILDTEKDISFDRITEAASTITHSPIALVSLVDGERQWFKSKVGLDVSETSRDLAFCAHVIAQSDDKIFVVCDALEDDRFKYSDLVLGGPFIRFYAGAPLIVEGDDGCKYKIGTLCVIDRKPRNLEGHLHAVMETLAKLVVTEINKHRGLSDIPINVIQEYLEVRAPV